MMKRILLILAVLLVMLLSCQAAEGNLTFGDGQTHYLSYPVYGDVSIYGDTILHVVDGGQVLSEGSLRYYDNSSGTMFGGFVAGGVIVRGSADFIMSGGIVTNQLLGFDAATIVMDGGQVHGLTCYSGYIGLEGGDVVAVLVSASSNTLEVSGTDFTIDGEPVGSTTIGTETTGFLTGTLAAGDEL